MEPFGLPSYQKGSDGVMCVCGEVAGVTAPAGLPRCPSLSCVSYTVLDSATVGVVVENRAQKASSILL
ncbi:hypothetical protein ml_497 [Mollivirus sibericum]|uniref:hypothetical protein n=1 Tax=Mollivirus sibericum TaxID=1678078 RepID=UPI0006B2DF81|nr:hypothetical protein ml_497 [Mollivirus sibericum]ALD62299.1 hypothetical protein ml_497 [Mollivirus sibericum]